MVKIDRTVIINAPVEKVFAYMTNPANLPEIWPCLVEVNDLHQTREGTGTTYNWVYKMAGTHFEGTAEITEFIPNQRLVIKDEGGIRAIRTITLQPVEGGTKYTLQMDYVLPPSLLGKLDPGFVQRLNECEADVVMANLKVRMEAETLKV
jgi:uncharacterized protein YndB with AHSA1/START domain